MGQPGDEPREGKVRSGTVTAAIITAIATVIAAVITTGLLKGDDKVSSRPTVLPPSTSTSAPTREVPSVQPRRSNGTEKGSSDSGKRLVLTWNYSVDFDTDPWTVASSCPSSTCDIYLDASGLQQGYGAQLAVLLSDEASTREDCLASTNYRSELRYPTLAKGSRICVKTNMGTIALLTVNRVEVSSSESVLSVNMKAMTWRESSS
jgi:hypothetical protein